MNEKNRIENSLWGLFISDALSMPAHWYYKLEYLRKDFGTIDGYINAPHPHPESFMVGNGYHPDVLKAKELDRPYESPRIFRRLFVLSQTVSADSLSWR